MSPKEAVVPTLTRQELARFSDAAGRIMAETDGHNLPVASRHSERFAELSRRHSHARVVMSVTTRVSGSMVMPCHATALPDR